MRLILLYKCFFFRIRSRQTRKLIYCHSVHLLPTNYFVLQLEDCALQIYRYHNGTQGDYSTYLDLESTIDEQAEDLEGFQDQ